MEYFVDEHSVVRQIWGKGDCILLIFAGSAAEFALSKSIDWLYFTGRIPSDPIGRFFSTVSYAQTIIFSDKRSAKKAINKITAIHKQVEQARNTEIPDWAYRDVLFMLIDYSIRSFELLERKLTIKEKKELFNVFYKVGDLMDIQGLPETFEKWTIMREQHLKENLEYSFYTKDLFSRYKNNLGVVRYKILLEVQSLIVPQYVRQLLGFRKTLILKPLINLYNFSSIFNLNKILKELLLPPSYRMQINKLDIAHQSIIKYKL